MCVYRYSKQSPKIYLCIASLTSIYMYSNIVSNTYIYVYMYSKQYSTYIYIHTYIYTYIYIHIYMYSLKTNT